MGRIFWGLIHNPFSNAVSKASDPRINLLTLRRLAKNRNLWEICAENLRIRIDQGQILPQELFKFPLPLISKAVEKVETRALAQLVAKIEKGIPLPLWKMKRCYFEPLHAGTVELLYLYYSIPGEKNRQEFLKLVDENNLELSTLAREAIEKNLLIAFSKDAEGVKRNLQDIMIYFHLAPANFY